MSMKDYHKIVDSMTLEDIDSLVSKYVINHLDRVLTYEEKRLRPVALKLSRTGRTFFKPVYKKDPHSDIEFCIHICCDGKSDYKKNGLIFIVYAYFYWRNGLYVMFVTNDRNKNFIVFPPHFFYRYRERFIKDESLCIKNVIENFFKKNNAMIGTDYSHPKYPDSIIYSCSEGVCFGSNEGNNIIIKTFVTFDMLRNGQIEIGQELYSDITQYYKKLYNLDISIFKKEKLLSA